MTRVIGRNVLVGGRPQVLWEGLAELRANAPSKARGAEGERGRPPPSTNTQCPITPGTRQTRPTKSDFPVQQSRKVTLPATRFVHPHSWSQPTKTPTFPHQHTEKLPFQQHAVSYNQELKSQRVQPPPFGFVATKDSPKTNTTWPISLFLIALERLCPHATS